MTPRTSSNTPDELSSSQVTDTVLMVEPARFTNNPHTPDNVHQAKLPEGLSYQEYLAQRLVHQEQALVEFAGVRRLLEANGINVLTLKDTLYPDTPDSIFPNNWVSFHPEHGGTMALYPMMAPNRRQERRPNDVAALMREAGFKVSTVVDDLLDSEKEKTSKSILPPVEPDPRFLEGTGSLVLDRANRVAYASLSKRTDAELFIRWAMSMDYYPVTFDSWEDRKDERGDSVPVYHTNVVMSVGENVAVLATEAINAIQRKKVIDSLSQHHDVVEITPAQMSEYAGNVLQLRGKDGAIRTVMSSRAHAALRQDQLDRLLAHGQVIHAPIPTIEDQGGGSMRCMLAEVFLPRQDGWKFRGEMEK